MKHINIKLLIAIVLISSFTKVFSQINTAKYNDGWIWTGATIDGMIYDYHKTQNLTHLQKAFWKSNDCLLHRCDIAGDSDYQGKSPAAWLGTLVADYPHVSPIANATAMFGMAELVYTIYNNRLIHDVAINYSDYPAGTHYFKDKTLIEAADILYNYLDETLEYFDLYWENKTIGEIKREYHGFGSDWSSQLISGFYRASNERHFNTPSNGSDWRGKALPFNYQTQFGEVMFYLYLAKGDPKYLSKITRIANLYKELNIKKSDYKILYDFSYSRRIEDDHMIYIARFLSLCYQNGIIITNTDMRYMADVFTNTYYLGPNSIAYTSSSDSKEDISRDYLYFSNFGNNELYTIIADVLSGNYGYNALDKFSQYHKFKLQKAYRGLGSSSQFAGIAAGDLDGDGQDEIVVNRNYDGFYILDYSENSATPSIKTFTGYGSASQWIDVTTGDFDGDRIDEIVAARNYKGNGSYSLITILKRNTSTGNYYVLTERNAPFTDINWAGIGAGDFNDDGRDEIFAVGNSSNNSHCGYYLFKFDGSNIVEETSARSIGWGSSSDWTGATAGDFDGNGIDEVVVMRNYDKIFRVLKLNSSGQFETMGTLNADHINGWNDFSAGDIDGDCKDELVAVSTCDNSNQNDDIGDMYLIEYENDKFEFYEKEYFRCEEQIAAVGIGNILNGAKEEIVYARDYDGAIFTYSYKYGNSIVVDDDFPTYSNLNNKPYDIYSENILTLESSNFDNQGADISLVAAGSIIFKPGFSYTAGSSLTARIDPWYSTSATTPNYEYPECANLKSSKEVGFNIEEDRDLKDNHIDQSILIYPNPNNGIFTIRSRNNSNISNIKVFNSLGQIIYTIADIDEVSLNLNIEDIEKGMYIVQCLIDDKYYTATMCIQ